MADTRKIYAYMRKSTNKVTQKTDRQESTIKNYALDNDFEISEWYSDTITGATKADNRPDYSRMKNTMREGDTLIISDVDRLGRDADNVIMEMKQLAAMGIRVVALDVPYMNDWNNVLNDSMFRMITDIYITLKAHLAQQEKEKTRARIMQGLEATKEKGTKLGRPQADVPKEFITAYKQFQSGVYGKMTAIQFCKMQNIGRSTFYKYVDKLQASSATA